MRPAFGFGEVKQKATLGRVLFDKEVLGGSPRRIRKADPKASVSILILYHNDNILSIGNNPKNPTFPKGVATGRSRAFANFYIICIGTATSE